MNDIALTLALHFALFAAVCIVLRFFGRQISWKPLLGGLACIAAYWVVSIAGRFLQTALPFSASLHWNWGGKLCAIIVALAVLFLSPTLSPKQVGLTWRQRSGSIWPALFMMIAMCALDWIDASVSSVKVNLSSERLLFQAIMPGLDEELVFRGLVLTFFVRAFGEGPVLAGARFGVAEVMVTLLFAAAHGLHVSQNTLAVDWHVLAITGALGAGLMWLRRRTDSLVLPVIAHNLVNFGESFF